MPLRNRVQPDGQILAVQTRGLFTGNRGILHTADKVMGDALWKHRAWICCTLTWKDWRREVMTGRNWTELFFLDEAVAMAAGHRPCAYCRRARYLDFKQAWARQARGGDLAAPDMDAILHAARAMLGARALQSHTAPARDLPAGSFVQADQTYLLTHDAALPYGSAGYGAPCPRPQGRVTVLTSPPMLDVLRGGYVPQLHPSAQIPLFP